ncbi:MAG: hypothetical protein AAF577_09875 [Pseudomonadota bacterium]
MSTAAYGVIEILMFFGGILAFCWYQLHSIKKLRREDQEARNRGEDPVAARAEKPRSGEDIFWDTLAKKRK